MVWWRSQRLRQDIYSLSGVTDNYSWRRGKITRNEKYRNNRSFRSLLKLFTTLKRKKVSIIRV